MASTYLSRTNGTETTRTKCTFSAWIKYDQTSGTNTIIVATDDSGANTYFQIELKPDIDVQIRDGSSSTYLRRRSNAKLRDASGFYHIVVTWDSTLGTADDRLKIFLNGERITSFSDNTGTVDSNYNCPLFKSSIPMKIGVGQSGSSNFFSGIMSHIHATDGYAYEASAFGETDATTGEWKINTSPSVTYGDNGFFILKNGNSVTDQSGEGNNWTVGGGTLTNTEDCPSDVFATLNPLDNYYASSSFANGNTYLNTSSSNYTFNNSTLGYNKGKFYWEIKVTQNSGYDHLGITSKGSTGSTNYMYDSSYSYCLKQSGVLKENTGSGQQTVSGFSGTSYSTDIISIAHDADNNKIYFAKDGVWMNSANPNTPTGGITTTAASATDTGVWLPAFGDEYASGASIYLVNFGNGYFGTTSISSEGTNASGIGKFEYDVPTGFTALSTKGLNE